MSARPAGTTWTAATAGLVPPPRGQIVVGDAATRLSRFEADSVDQVVTSPPYFRLRDYGHDGQLGLEPHVNDWRDQLVAVARQAARVLVPSGTLWLNLGDTYAVRSAQGAPRKSLLLAPERLVLALLADGWILRNKIIWAKTNHLPTSASDRLATSYEVVYLLSRRPRYFFDLDAVRLPHRSRAPKPHLPCRSAGRRERWRGPNSDNTFGLAGLKAEGRIGHHLGKNPGDVWALAASNYRGAHHATFPVALADRMLRAGCPEVRCTACRSPWRRRIRGLGKAAVRGALAATCDCASPAERGLVVDPFMGAGTTAVAAEAIGRDWCGIDLNADYVRLAQGRIQAARAASRVHRQGRQRMRSDTPKEVR